MRIAAITLAQIALTLLTSTGMQAAQAAETAYTVRPTEIKQEPMTDATTLATLPEKAAVEILQRQGGWVRIKSQQANGWLRLLSLRLSLTPGETQKGDSGMQSLFNVARTGSSGTVVATGVRGLSEDDLKNAHPNPQELKKMHGYAASKSAAQNFSREAKLKPQDIGYLSAPSQHGQATPGAGS